MQKLDLGKFREVALETVSLTNAHALMTVLP
jgi:hypothetical protein